RPGPGGGGDLRRGTSSRARGAGDGAGRAAERRLRGGARRWAVPAGAGRAFRRPDGPGGGLRRRPDARRPRGGVDRMNAAGGDAVLELRDVRKVYPGAPPVESVRGVTLTVRRGELVAVVGPSGSGKSTLVHVMAALERPTSGVVRIAGGDVARLS